MKNTKLPALLNTPLGMVIMVGAVVLVVEFLFMSFHRYIETQFNISVAAMNFLDAFTVTAAAAPLLYFLVFRRMQGDVERQRQINAAALNAIVIVDGDARITDWNPAAEKMFQYSREEAVGQQLHQLIAPPRYHDDAVRGFARFQESGGGPVVGKITEIAALRKDGSEFPVELSISAVKLKNSWHAIGVIRDLTERKRAEELASAQHAEIKRARLDWNAVFDSVGYPIFLHDSEFRVIRANRAYADQAGKPFKEIIGQPYYTLFPKSDTPLPSCQRGMEKAEEEEEEEVSVGEASYLSRSFSVRNEQGVYLYSVHLLEDITERKRAEKERQESGVLLKDALEDAIGAIAATLEQRDPYTAGHQRRVAQLAAAIATEMGLSREAIEGIHFGGLIHDLGKISVPAEILGKPGRLTDIELDLIKTHAEAGYEIVREVAFPWPVADMVRQHHERLDGSGYPQRLKGDEIVLEARILAVADVVEAMSADRPYRPGFGMDAALGEIMRYRGIQLDEAAVDACLHIIKEKGFVFTK